MRAARTTTAGFLTDSLTSGLHFSIGRVSGNVRNDTDDDGVLNAAEMQSVPPTDQLLPPRGPTEKRRSFQAPPVDADADGSVTLAELTEYVCASGGPPFDFKPAPSLHAAQVDTCQVIDENRDGVLDEPEIQAATRSLLKYDANADEIIDQRELSISGRPQIVPGVGDQAAELLSVLAVVDPETDGAVDALFNRLVEKYDRPAPIRESTGGKPTGNGLLDADELGAARDQFAARDINGDGMVRSDELLAFAELQSRLFGSRVVLLLSNASQSIIDLIDESGDGDLALRELRQAPEKLLLWDLNGDGRITPRERPDNRQLILQNGETILFRWDQLQNRSDPVTTQTETGPDWFRHMDINRDGDISPHEFPGRIESFRRLDADSDGLISVSEAASRK